MIILSPAQLYKSETGNYPTPEIELEFDIWRSKGQWVIDITDEEKFNIWRNRGFIQIKAPDEDYIRWLEEKIMELINHNNNH